MTRIPFKFIVGAVALLVALGTSVLAIAPGSQIARSRGYTGPPGYHPCTAPVDVSTFPPTEAEDGWAGAEVTSTDVWDNQDINLTLYACAANSFYENVTAEDSGAVQQYVDTNITLASATPLSSITQMTSNYRAYGTPPTCTGNDYEYARDIWWGGATEWSGKSTEEMIWDYTCNQVPAGTDVATTTIGGQTYQVWTGTTSAGNIVTFKDVSNVTSDQANLLAFGNYMEANGDLPNGAYLWQPDDGAEICYTNGTIRLGLEAFNLVINGNGPITEVRGESSAARAFKMAFNRESSSIRT